MYNDFFGFRERPFSVTPDPRVFYTTPAYQQIYNNIVQSVHDGTSLSVVTGEVGTGKTTMLRRIMRDLEGAVRFAYFTYTTLPFEDLLDFLCQDLEIPHEQGGQLQKLKALQEFLIARRYEGQITALLIDEAQDLQESVLDEIRHLLNLTTEDKTLLPVVLVGQPELEKKLAQPTVYQLRQRVVLHCQLDRLKESDVGPFITHRLQSVGCIREDLFTPEAVQRVTSYAQGIPRLINILCDNALLLGYSISQQTISAEMIDEVSQDLWLQRTVDPQQDNLLAQPAGQLASTWLVPSTLQHEDERPLVLVSPPIDQLLPITIENTANTNSRFSFPLRTSSRQLAWVGAGLAFALWSVTFLPDLGREHTIVPASPSVPQDNTPSDTPAPTMTSLLRSDELGALRTRQDSAPVVPSAKEETPIKKSRKEEPVQTKEEKTQLIEVSTTSEPPVTTRSQGRGPIKEGQEKEPQPLREQETSTPAANSRSSREHLLLEVASQGDIEKGEHLLSEGSGSNTVDERGWTVLMMATLRGHLPMVELLLKKGADVNLRNTTGGTALMMAAIQGRNDILQPLLDKGAEVNTQDIKGWTALMYAARNGHTPTVQILLSSGAEVDLKNAEGQTALMFATSRGHQETARTLQDGKAGGNVIN